MRLLVSVRSAMEVRPALSGGADVIDAKDPARGALGAVSLEVLREIARVVPYDVPLSVALGDLTDCDQVARSVREVQQQAAGARDELYVKLGLAGTPDVDHALRLASAAIEAARARGKARLIVVAYADHALTRSPTPRDVIGIARDAGASGVLLDTYGKDGRDLFQYVQEEELRAWASAGKAANLLVALAGSLDQDGVRRAAMVPADVVGVRGSACEGGRGGRVVETRVRALVDALAAAPDLVT
jgi:uncharacterized protein (UPF0264 family)